MPNNSSVPAVKGALLTMLITALPTTTVSYAMSAAAFDETRESAWLGQAEFGEEVVAGFRTSLHPHNEAYTVPVVVMASIEGDDPQATEARAWTLAALFEDALRQSPVLGVSNVHWAKIVNKEVALHPRDSGWVSSVAMLVGVQARI